MVLTVAARAGGEAAVARTVAAAVLAAARYWVWSGLAAVAATMGMAARLSAMAAKVGVSQWRDW